MSIDTRVIVYYLDYREFSGKAARREDRGIVLKRFRPGDTIPPEIMQQLVSQKASAESFSAFFQHFFSRGAELWIAECDNSVVGYHWSKQGGFDHFYNFPVTSHDVILMASEVLPAHRGKGYNPAMILKISEVCFQEGCSRIYIGVNRWNTGQIRSIAKIPFTKLGTVRKFRFRGRFITIWSTEGNR